jgi:hypothetical protein
MDTHFSIDLITSRTHDKLGGDQFPAPTEALGISGEIEQFISNILRFAKGRKDKLREARILDE